MARLSRVLVVTALFLTPHILAHAEEEVNNETCLPALQGEDCTAYPFEVCDESAMICVHKPIFPA